MKPILYPHNETKFDTNGLGILADAISCTVKWQLNGLYEAELKYPDTGPMAQLLTERRILLCKADPVAELQPFKIYRITKTSGHVITAYARHLAYDLDGIPLLPFEASGIIDAITELGPHAAIPCPFEFITDKTADAPFSVPVPTTIWRAMGGTTGSLLDTYGGEYEFNRFHICLHNHLGRDRGVSIRYGKNLTSLEQDQNCAAVYTGIMPYWTDRQTKAVTLLPEKIVATAGTYDFTRILPVDLTDQFETAPTEEQLRQAAVTYNKSHNIGVPRISWRVEFVELSQTEEYRDKALLERVLPGDTVSVEFPQMGVSASARAVAYVYDSILERYDSVTLGSVRSNLASTIAEAKKEIQKKPDSSTMQAAIEALTGAIIGASGGAVRLLDDDGDGYPDTLYIADNPHPAQAIKVWRFNFEGWGASKTGYNGPYVMGATLEDEGMLASFIKTGILDASLIKTGIIRSLNGKLEIDLNKNQLTVQTDEGKVVMDGGEIRGYGIDTSTGKMVQTMMIHPGWLRDGNARTVIRAQHAALDIDGEKGASIGNMQTPTILNGSPVQIQDRPLPPPNKDLWAGVVKVGATEKIPNAAPYHLFVIWLGQNGTRWGTPVMGYRTGNQIRGIGGYCGTATAQKEIHFVTIEAAAATAEAENWKVIDAGYHSLGKSGTMAAGVRMDVCKVAGII